MNKKLMIAPAGAGKTTYLIREALGQSADSVLVTYTKTNFAAIKEQILAQKGEIPANLTLRLWDDFRAEEKLYDKIYVDEAQDLAGLNLAYLEQLLHTDCEMLIAGDPRQVTANVRVSERYQRFGNGAIEAFFRERCSEYCEIDKETLRGSFRMNQAICSYVQQVNEQYGPIESNQHEDSGHDGVYLVNFRDIPEYLERYAPMQMRNRKSLKLNENYPWMMIADTKGREFDHVLLYPCARMYTWMRNHESAIQTRNLENIYQALSRARYSAAIAYDYDEDTNIPGVIKYK